MRQGTRLNQLRFRRGTPKASDTALRAAHEAVGLVGASSSDMEPQFKGGLRFSVDLRGPGVGPVAYRAKPVTFSCSNVRAMMPSTMPDNTRATS